METETNSNKLEIKALQHSRRQNTREKAFKLTNLEHSKKKKKKENIILTIKKCLCSFCSGANRLDTQWQDNIISYVRSCFNGGKLCELMKTLNRREHIYLERTATFRYQIFEGSFCWKTSKSGKSFNHMILGLRKFTN